MKTIFRLLSTCAIGALALGGCSDSSGTGTGLLTVRLTDAPFPFSQVASVDVYVVRVDARQTSSTDEQAADESSEGWTTVATPNALINLLDLGSGKTVNLGATTLLHEAYLDVAGRDARSFPDRARFMGYMARVIRGLIIDHARRNRSLKRGANFDVVTANLTGGLHLAVADRLVDLTSPGGLLILSGIMASEANEVLARFAGCDLVAESANHLEQRRIEFGRRGLGFGDPVIDVLVGRVHQRFEGVEPGFVEFGDALVGKRAENQVNLPKTPAPGAEFQLFAALVRDFLEQVGVARASFFAHLRLDHVGTVLQQLHRAGRILEVLLALQQPEGARTSHQDVHPPVGRPFQHLGDLCTSSHLLEPLVRHPHEEGFRVLVVRID